MAKTDTVDPTATGEGGKKPAGRPAKKKAFKKRGEKRVVHSGYAHIQASFNNTIITITDADGAVVAWSSAGGIGFKGSRKGTPFAATQAAIAAGNAAKAFGMRSVEVRVKGPGAGASRRFARCRRSASRSSRSATSRRFRTTGAGRRRGGGSRRSQRADFSRDFAASSSGSGAELKFRATGEQKEQ